MWRRIKETDTACDLARFVQSDHRDCSPNRVSPDIGSDRFIVPCLIGGPFCQESRVEERADFEEFVRQEFPDGESPHMNCEVGHPVEEIIKRAEDLEADLIVVGTHGRAGFKRAMIGSVAERIVRHATCPVLVVR
jgi:hypothetical protein